jgi:hypothetical protein
VETISSSGKVPEKFLFLELPPGIYNISFSEKKYISHYKIDYTSIKPDKTYKAVNVVSFANSTFNRVQQNKNEDINLFVTIKRLRTGIKEYLHQALEVLNSSNIVNCIQIQVLELHQIEIGFLLIAVFALLVLISLAVGRLIITLSVRAFLARVYNRLSTKIHARQIWKHLFYASVATQY